jgi:hypothetical protein
MKRLIAVLFLLPFFTVQSSAQCNEQLVDKCYPTIDGYTYLKDFKFRLKEGSEANPRPTAKFQLILSKDTKYLLTACNAEEMEGKVIYQLFDASGLLASSFNPQTKKHYESIEFICKKSGLYYLAYTFEDNKQGCAIGMIAFER